MSQDDTTIALYDAKSTDYAKMVRDDARNPSLERFIAVLPHGAHVLDVGCGPGHASAALQNAGFTVDALDASAGMVRLARKKYGIHARHATFDDIDAQQVYDGVWANFSLLHATKAKLPGHLDALCSALKPGGILHLGMKLGQGERRDRLNRFYAYYSQPELEALVARAGFCDLAHWLGRDTGLDGTPSDWIIITAHV